MQLIDSVRVLLFDPQGRIFLVCTAPQSEQRRRRHWMLPGRCVDAGELPQDTARRELTEINGLPDTQIRMLAWFAEGNVSLGAEHVRYHTRYFVAHVGQTAPAKPDLTPKGRKTFVEGRWWSLHDILKSSEVFVPPNLGRLISDLIQPRPIAPRAITLPDHDVNVPGTPRLSRTHDKDSRRHCVRLQAAPYRPSKKYSAIIAEAIKDVSADCDDIQDWLQNYALHHADRLATDLYLVERYVHRRSGIVEFGSTPPLLTLALQRTGWPVVGIDLNPSRFANAIATHGLRVMQCDIEQECIPLPTAGTETILFNEIFEHLRINLIFTFAEIRRILKPGGLLMMSTPNLLSHQGLFNFIVRRKGAALCDDVYTEYQKLAHHGHMGHVREYTCREVCDFLSKVGFQVEVLVFRELTFSRAGKVIGLLMPRLRPFITYIARAQ